MNIWWPIILQCCHERFQRCQMQFPKHVSTWLLWHSFSVGLWKNRGQFYKQWGLEYWTFEKWIHLKTGLDWFLNGHTIGIPIFFSIYYNSLKFISSLNQGCIWGNSPYGKLWNHLDNKEKRDLRQQRLLEYSKKVQPCKF